MAATMQPVSARILCLLALLAALAVACGGSATTG